MEHGDYGSDGSNTITDTWVSIKLNGFKDTKVYAFSTGENSLKFTATAGLSADNDLTKK